jgi:hypothetical protein
MNRGLETKRFDAIMEAIQSLKVSHEININPEVDPDSIVRPDGVLRWGVWLLVVMNLISTTSIIFYLYMSFFHG